MRVILVALLGFLVFWLLLPLSSLLVFWLLLPLSGLLVGLEPGDWEPGSFASPTVRLVLSYLLTLLATGALMRKVWRLMTR
jgi:putative effector of murein hydrolase LrgA (UPF0299 family)